MSAVQRCRGQEHMTDQHCKQIFAMLSEYLDGELPVKNCRELERHLKGCRPCIAYLESLKTTVEACRRYKAPRAPALSKQVKAALLAAVRKVISTDLSE
jgi:anti-sigma factor RsiW